MLENRPLAPDLLEPGGDHDRRLHPLSRQEGDRLDDRGRGDYEHPEIHTAGNRPDVPVEGSPEDLPTRRVHPVDLSRESRSDQVGEHAVADLPRVAGSTQHGNGFRVKQFRGNHQTAYGEIDVVWYPVPTSTIIVWSEAALSNPQRKVVHPERRQADPGESRRVPEEEPGVKTPDRGTLRRARDLRVQHGARSAAWAK